LHTTAGARTLSGQKNSHHTAFLYARKIIFREEVPAGKQQAEEQAKRDEDPGSEADTESDGEENPGPSPKQRKKKTGSASENKKPMELVRCCHCRKTLGPYKSSYTTTSAFKRSSSALLLLKHWLKQTEVNPCERWGYEEPKGIAEAVAGEGEGTQSDHDAPEGVDLDAEAALNSCGLLDLSD
jgi:hypothetical protein